MVTTAPTMPAVPVGDFEPGSPEWHAARANGIGGSEFAAVLGLSPYESKFSLWHRKQGMTIEVQESDAMYWGKVHEPGIARRYQEEHPEQTVIAVGTYRHPQHEWWISNPDRLAINADGSMEIVEIKTSRYGDDWGQAGTDQVPIWYRVQVVSYGATFGIRRARLVVLIGGSEYREYVVDITDDEIATLAAAGAEFMQSLTAGERPPIDGHTATYQVVRNLPDGLEDTEHDVAPDLRDRYFAAIAAHKAAEEEKRAAAGLLLDHIGNGRRAVCAGKTVATRTVRDGKTYSLIPTKNRSAA